MWRYAAGGVAAILLIVAGWFVFSGRARSDSVLPAVAARAAPAAGDAETLPDTVPEATAKTREQKRFGRYDKDRDGKVTRDEYLASRRKAFAKLDADGDGRLSFEEWSVKAITKFATADADRSGAMDAKEFATTATKRSTRPKPNCPPLTRERPTAAEANEEG